jgi:hypothetical protein
LPPRALHKSPTVCTRPNSVNSGEALRGDDRHYLNLHAVAGRARTHLRRAGVDLAHPTMFAIVAETVVAVAQPSLGATHHFHLAYAVGATSSIRTLADLALAERSVALHLLSVS